MKIQHALAAFAVPMLLALAPVASQAGSPDPQVTQLVKQSGLALHTSAMQAIHVVHFTGKSVLAGISGSAEGWDEIGGLRSAELYSAPPFSGGTGWDGKHNWNLDQTGLVWVDASDAGTSQTIVSSFLLNYDLWKTNFGGATVTYGGMKTEKGQTYDVLTVSVPGSKIPADLWIDRATHLPERIVDVIGSTTFTVTLADFHAVHGLMIPYEQVTATSDGNTTSLTIAHADVNPAGGNARLLEPRSSVHDFSIANGATQTIVPIEISENHVYLTLMLNGKGPYHFIYDTGGQNIVDPAVAKEIGALGKGSVQGGGVGSATESMSFATVDSMQIGDATVKNQVFALAPVREGFGMAAGLPVDGLIGFEVLSRFVTTFDYANNRVILQMPGTYTPPAGADVIPIVQDGQQPQFACTIENVPTECTVDTGARDSISLFSPFMKANPQVVPATLSANGANGFGVGGAAFGKLGRLQDLSFGSFTLHNVIGDFTTQTEGAFAAPFVGANVGGAIWKRFTVTLDYNNLTMTLTPNATFDSPDSYDRSGLFLINRGGVCTIADARDGTPATKAGLAKGDALVSVDGTPTTTMTLKAIRETLGGPAGTAVHLVVKDKSGSTHEVTLTLADYV